MLDGNRLTTHHDTQIMASSTCWRCLSRSSSQLSSSSILYTFPVPSTALFSTTSRSLAMPQQKKPSAKTSTKGAKSFALKKKVVVKSGKPPMPGERKAMRKRIVLSNSNALQVEGLEDLSRDLELARHVGKVFGIPGEIVDSLRAVEAFKVSQGWGMFRRPALLIREESVKLIEGMKRSEAEKTGLVLVIDGERGTGKSLMLLHAMATAFVRGWIVLNIPEGIASPFSLLTFTDICLQHKNSPTLLQITLPSITPLQHYILRTHTPQTGSPKSSNPTTPFCKHSKWIQNATNFRSQFKRM